MDKKSKIVLARIILGGILFAVCMLLPLGGIYETAAFLLIYVILGYDVVIKAVRNIFSLRFLDENFLMAAASIGAFCIGDHPEAVSVMLFYQIGELFLDLAVSKSRKSISALMDLKVEYANVIRNGEVFKVESDKIQVGDTILVKSGEKVPVDCIVSEGESTVDTSALTGESLPRSIKEGDSVLSGSVNVSSGFKAKASKQYIDSTAAKILELAENAAHKKAKTEKFITKFAKYYTPAVVFMAIFIAIVPYLIVGGDIFDWIKRGLIFLVVSCPCALVISVPMGFFAGIGAGALNGCIIKGSVVLEKLAKVKKAVFDKTGTLTTGKIEILDFACADENEKNREEILRLAAHAESMNNHPVGRAVMEYYGKEIDTSIVKNVNEFIGKGVGCEIEGQEIYVGNETLLKQLGFDISDEGESCIHVVIDGRIKAHMKFGDRIKDNSAKVLKNLKRLGIEKCIMLTGDSKKQAENVAELIGVDEVYSSLLPADKVDKIERIKKSGDEVLFVGDGINDSPVLAMADAGIAMGMQGSDAAIEAADIVIMNDDLQCIEKAIKISRKTMRIVKQNIVFALGVKLVVLVLGSLGIAGMWAAVFADVGVSVLAVINSMRCLKLTK